MSPLAARGKALFESDDVGCAHCHAGGRLTDGKTHDVGTMTGEEHKNYKAFNIVGLVAAADMGASQLMGTSTSTMGDVDFAGLVIDESKTHGLLLFRLAEATNAIVVHEEIKAAIDAAQIPGFVFYGPGEWSG